jgi:2-haloacid dehalogenase
MKKFDALEIYPDVPQGLQRLAAVAGQSVTPVVFSNGTRSMIEGSLTGSQQLMSHRSVFQQVVVVDDVKRYKPAPEVYQHLAASTGKANDMGSIWLISSNPFDIVGARAQGMQAGWVDRLGDGWTDRLLEGDRGKPTIIGGGVDEVIDQILKLHGK